MGEAGKKQLLPKLSKVEIDRFSFSKNNKNDRIK